MRQDDRNITPPPQKKPPKDAFFVLMLVDRHAAAVAGSFCHILYSHRLDITFVFLFFSLRRNIAAARSAVAPLLIPPPRRLLAAAPQLMQITGMYEGYFVRCRVETMACKRGGMTVKKNTTICPPPPLSKPQLSEDPSVPPIASEMRHAGCASIMKTARVSGLWEGVGHRINRRRHCLAK